MWRTSTRHSLPRTEGLRPRFRLGLAALLVLVSPPAASSDGAAGDGRAHEGFRFVNVAPEAGIDRIVHAGRAGKDHLLDSAGAGVAWLDYDRDGHLDAYIVNGWKLEEGRVLDKGLNALYRNRGDGTFEDVTRAAGVTGEGEWGGGVAVADYDSDGWPDLLVTNFGRNLLYRNRGDGTFVNVAAEAGIEAPGWNTGAAFLDADGDGDLDLYIARYIEATLEEVLAARRTLDWKGVEMVAPGPFGLSGARDVFFLSDGKGKFRDATLEAGLEDKGRGYGFAVIARDFNSDGRPDLYVANDSDANYFYRNEGGGVFREVGLWAGSALDSHGAAQAGMGVAEGDYDGDGHPDLLVTNFSQDFTTMYRGDGSGFFEDVSNLAGVGEPTFLPLSWGALLADLDNDTDLDLVIANGHIYPQVDEHPEFGMAYEQRNQLLENSGAGRFSDATDRAGPGFQLVRSSRGLAAGDYDNDGDLDLLISNLDAAPDLLRNDSATGAWLGVALEAPPGGGTAIGAEVIVESAGRRMERTAASGGSFLSVHDPRLHFGLGAAESVDRITVRWPDGKVSTLEKVPASRYVTIRKP